ncbi:hypothetical protein V9T40_008007 [Parthenolecanium corni]|uniref:C2H2-type domain-containing protein n=1 Tax=Parthenolecanium corni TaxID=536013 RepID=A0AAN9Y733_9HEMI
MSESKAGELIDIDNDILNPGDTINVFNFLTNDWKNAIVQEIDITEREILVNYEDDSQEWISVDTRKIRFPPVELQTPTPSRRRTSTLKVIENIESKPVTNVGEQSSTPVIKDAREKSKKVVKSDASSSKKSKSSSSKSKSYAKSSEDKKAMSNQTSSLWRLKFKSNNQKESNQRKRDKRDYHRKTKPLPQTEINVSENNQDQSSVPKITFTPKPVAKPRNSGDGAKKKRRESERKEDDVHLGCVDVPKRKTPSRKNSISTCEQIEKTETQSKSAPLAPSVGKKIKTLLPKRASELLAEPESSCPLITHSTPDIITPTPALPPLPASLSSIQPPANISPLTITSAASGFICPKQDCKKQFRNENLLMMHLKHYHPEYRNMLRSMPNVADLAYARTVGESIDSPQSGFLEKIAKLEEDKLKERNDDSLLIEKSPDGLAKGSKPPKKSVVGNKRLSDSAPSSPKMPALLAQLQEPPLIPPSISIHAESTDSELSILHSAPMTPGSPQVISKSKASHDKSPILNKTKAALDKPFVQSDSEDKCSDGKKSPTRKRRLSHLDSTDVINCTCGYGFEDGLMIRCDLCLCWQHGACNAAENEEDVPSMYICEPCRYPRRLHSSKKYSYVQNWVKEGIMPAFEFCEPPEEILKRRENSLKQFHENLCHLMDLKNAVRSLQVKLQILKQTPDHPKLYLWAKSWDEKKLEECEKELIVDGERETFPFFTTACILRFYRIKFFTEGPVPEAAINTADCRKNLSEHIAEEMTKVENALTKLEGEIEKLDGDDDDEDTFGKNPDKDRSVVKQTLLMMMRDLSSIQNLKYC